jgi:hypothetical protein
VIEEEEAVISRSGTSTPAARDRLGRHAPTIAFAAYAVAAGVLIVFVIGRHRWFFGDEWSFLAERNAGNLGDLFQAHGEHWSTIPVISYRILWNLFGLRTYVPYQAVVAVMHLATAVLLRTVMVRAGVRGWTATVVAAGFLLFGPGQENILWAFQIGFVGALMFGLVQLILSDHDGAIGRRDAVALLAGTAALMCSGVALPMIAVVGVAVLARRGWKAAAFQVLPLAAMYGIWFLATSPGGIDNPYGRNPTIGEISRFVWSGLRGAFVALGGFGAIGVLLAVLLLVGAWLAWTDRRAHRRLVAPAALLGGALLFLVGTGFTRWFVTPTADSQSRYLYTLAALFLPALAVAVDAVIKRWRLVTPLVFAVLLVATVKNATDFNSAPFDAAYFRDQKQLVLAMARSPFASQVPAYVRPSPWFTIGWLRRATADDDVPEAGPVTPQLARRIQFQLSIAQLDGEFSMGACRTFPRGTVIQPAKGERLGIRFAARPEEGASFFVQNAVVVSVLAPTGEPTATAAFKTDFGTVLEVESGGRRLRIAAADAHQPLILCRRVSGRG